MATTTYEKGTIKVVWIEHDPDEIYSKMFEDELDAERFAKKKGDYIIFSLVTQKNMEEFSWKILPYGKHKLYKKLIHNYQKYRGSILEKLLKFKS